MRIGGPRLSPDERRRVMLTKSNGRTRLNRKKLAYRLIERESIAGQKLYPLLTELVSQHHEELKEARIALAWNLSWQPDADGRVTLGKCKKASELDRELADYDFVI